MTGAVAVRVPASSANLGAGFDVLALAVGLYADVGVGAPPEDAHRLDEHHPATKAFVAAGGSGAIWMRSSIPVGRGLGFSGVARVGGAALAYAARDETPLEGHCDEVFDVARTLEGHGDNVAASVHGGIVGAVDRRVIRLRVGPTLRRARIVVWVPSSTTSTDRSRAGLDPVIARADAVHNLGRVVQFVAAVEHDDPELLAGATDDRLHQPHRLPGIAGADAALAAGTAAGAWSGWLSGSGPTVAFLVADDLADRVASALPDGGRTRSLSLDLHGVHRVDPGC